MQFVRIDDAVVHYQVIGAAPDKPAIVFANALGTDFRIWRDVIVRLAGKFTILTYDMRGHGLSDAGTSPVTIARHAEDLAFLIGHTGIGRAFVCGLSVGGMVAQQLALSHLELVRGLILCGTTARFADAETWDARIAAVEANGIAALADATLERWFTEAFRAPGNDELAGYRNMLTRQPANGYIGTCAALRDADLRAAVMEIAVPALCVAADHDGSTPPDVVAQLAKSIPGARYEVLKGAGHLMCVEQAEMLSEMIQAFTAMVAEDKTLN
ncbi:3-oxoadipate enol-lactonase [Pelagibacterium xiamenense]|uniref:3-oxoadipate enol-lactonase n=1 Tax=Pelagibacterium xiamenense TaxID=2901140 RepID=UPI001E399364|nr:3-oxoadipate enol-lactonase [Pelagibacterium xiamenense]MCD7059409.1 3-oxoadipate enol-lactonase [Pelagibacterium xiamenense]